LASDVDGEPGVPSVAGLAVASVDGAGLGVTGLGATVSEVVVLDVLGAVAPEAIELGATGTAALDAVALGVGVAGGTAGDAAASGATGAGTSMRAAELGAGRVGAAMLGAADVAALDPAEPRVGSGTGGAVPGIAGLAVVEPAPVGFDTGGSTTSREIFSRQSTRSRIGSCAHSRILSLAASVVLCAKVALECATAAARQIQMGFMAAAVLDGTGLSTLPASPRAARSAPQPALAGR
jgi:hypothetical protein